jgi:glycosyltransferase involved in cell wall biosynthesis
VPVLHLTTEFPPVIYGGLGTATGGLVKALVKAGVEAAVLLIGPTAGSSYGEFKPLFGNTGAQRRRSGGVKIFEVSWFQDIDVITRIVASWRADIVHLHSFWLWPIAQAIRQRLGTPLVYTVHSLDRAEYTPMRRPMGPTGGRDLRRRSRNQSYEQRAGTLDGLLSRRVRADRGHRQRNRKHRGIKKTHGRT